MALSSKQAVSMALVLGALLGAVLFGPTVHGWTTGFLGTDHVDAWGTQWFYWYLAESIAGRADLAHTDLLYFPWGKNLYLHTGGNLLDALLAWPLRQALGPVLGVNLFVVLVVVSNGLAAAWMVRGMGARPLGATVSGALFAFNPYVLSELQQGRIAQALLVFLCLFLGLVLRFPRWRGWGAALGAGLLLALTGLTYWFYALFAGMIAALWGGFHLVRPAGPRWGPLLRLVSAGAVALALVAPFAWPMLVAQQAGAVPGLLDVDSWGPLSWAPVTREGFEIALRTLDPLHRVAGFHMLSAQGTRFFPESTVLLVVQLLLAAVGLRVMGRHRLSIGVGLLASLLLACGPQIDPGWGPVDPLYIALVRRVGVFRRLWWPVRAVAVTQVLMVPLVAAAIDWLAGEARWRGALVPAGLGLAWGLELWAAGLLPMSWTPVSLPPAYACLVQSRVSDDLPGAVIELPLGRHASRLYYQTRHHHPLLGGMLDDNPLFAPARSLALVRDNALLRWLSDATHPPGEPQESPEDLARAQAGLIALGFRYVIVDRQVLAASASNADAARRASRVARARVIEALGRPVYSGPDAYVFTLAQAPWSCPP